MKILFLDQSGKLGGAELSLADVAAAYRDSCLVGLFADGPFGELLEERQIPHQVLTHQNIRISKDSSWRESLQRSASLVPLVMAVAKLARQYDVVYANTQKALVVGAIASFLARRPLVYHLRDILSVDHFSQTNRSIATTLANRFASLVIANSQATQAAFVEAGGRSELVKVVYNGFDPKLYQVSPMVAASARQAFNWDERFIIGHFSRLSPWKGQHILLEALALCDASVSALLVGDALFGEDDYVQQLHHQVETLGLAGRVKFLGFQSDIPVLMAACDGIAHTSTAPEPFGRVIVEAMLCGRPVIGAAAGGALELIEPDKTGWLCAPSDAKQLAAAIHDMQHHPDKTQAIAHRARDWACDNFHLQTTQQQISQLLESVLT
ncbi:glycosyltransferase [Halomicronema sp. CCY15110]|uniref:glycosyltransferase n=1 Tax=Halomicronema sp. CCY15110 TaxID=2767773 RepID=UPI00194E9A5B|nr:glycosyltransferase [Halomicronema sp. CCY15110]